MTVIGEDGIARCAWAGAPGVMRDYHDTEWGMPVTGDTAVFERLTLEAFQSGLSWSTILNKSATTSGRRSTTSTPRRSRRTTTPRSPS